MKVSDLEQVKYVASFLINNLTTLNRWFGFFFFPSVCYFIIPFSYFPFIKVKDD